MGKRKDISNDIKKIIINLYKADFTQTEIAKKANCSQAFVSLTIKKFQKTGECFQKRSYKPRIRKTSVRSDRQLEW